MSLEKETLSIAQVLEARALDSVKNPDDTTEFLRRMCTEMPLISIAISLKRIADAIEGNPEKYGLVDAISDAITNAITNAARNRG